MADRETRPPHLKGLRTARLRLEPLEEAHASVLFAGLRDPALYEFIEERPPESVEALAARYRRLAARQSPDGSEAWLNWAIVVPPSGGVVGWVQATLHPDRTAHIAYLLLRDAWGHGYAREAVAALLDHLRDDWAVGDVRATVDVRNHRSIAVVEALGFRRGERRTSRGAPSHDVEYIRVAR